MQTEFGLTSASNPTSDQVVQYLSSASDYMEGLDYVKKYAFFGAWATNPDGYASSNSACQSNLFCNTAQGNNSD